MFDLDIIMDNILNYFHMTNCSLFLSFLIIIILVTLMNHNFSCLTMYIKLKNLQVFGIIKFTIIVNKEHNKTYTRTHTKKNN